MKRVLLQQLLCLLEKFYFIRSDDKRPSPKIGTKVSQRVSTEKRISTDSLLKLTSVFTNYGRN